jgi:SulP family sulfate permease
VIALIIGVEACFCTNISSCITGDRRVQNNIEMISTGIANFLSVACGGLFVSPNIDFSMKNIESKSKTIISMIIIGGLSFCFVAFEGVILKFIPIHCISSILLVYATSILLNKNVFQYLNLRTNESYIFVVTFVVALYFGLISAIIVGFTLSNILFTRRMIRIKDATVHTTKNHDSGAIEFMTNKNGFSDTMKIPKQILKKIEVIQISNVLSLNIAKVVEEALRTKGSFPSVLVIYFRNVPYLDTEGFDTLKAIVRNVVRKGSIVMVSGTNGILLDILQKRADRENSSGTFGYIVPDFKRAIQQTIKRLGG